MNITDFSIEELKSELDKRLSDSENLSEKTYHLCIGIIDSDGAESLVPVDSAEEFSKKLSTLNLRARFNGHRSPEVYAIQLPQELIDVINARFTKGEYTEIGNMLKSFSTYKKLS